MKFLIIEQDLRVSGTSQGIISRSFLAKLRIAYPNSVIDVVYLKQYDSEDRLDLLPVDSIDSFVLDLKIPFFTKWLNKVYWRLFHISLKQRYIYKVYGSYIAKIDYHQYDHIFIRSAGLDCETILGAKDLPILKKAIVTFNEPYPTFWCTGSKSPMTNLELFKLKEMFEVVSQAKSCMATALLAEDMQYLYGSRTKFHSLPHQYDESVFDLSDVSSILKKKKKIMISYHGAIQFGRNIEIVLDAYQELMVENSLYKENTEFAIRVKGIDLQKLAKKYSKTPNIIILGTLNFSNSCNEQVHEADINIILENGPLYCNILVGKAPFLAAIRKPILSVSPEKSEIRRIITDDKYIASCLDKKDIKQKLENLIINRIYSDEPVYPLGDYFSDESFKRMLDKILKE
ncbi:hypothetical protein ACFX5F_11755 [Flavobacterium sp. ZS1P70]|uniref:Glycosyltransferase family 1 protein n=1 Tax=Flavobacterium zhoui TaxID=3230414 RepID=A0ABW6I6R2_9FLAO